MTSQSQPGRPGTVLDLTAKQQETALGKALEKVVARLQKDFGLQLHHAKAAKLADILSALDADFPEVPFGKVRPDTNMKPDGGILSIIDSQNKRHVILISEVVTMAMFGSLNEISLFNVGAFNRGSFYFQEKMWSVKKMEEVMYEVASRSIDYYRAKYGRRAFPQAT